MHRKASRYSMCQDINLSSVPSVGHKTGSSYSTTDRTDLADSLVEERDHKVSVGSGGIPPWVFRHRSLLKTSLGSTLWRNSQSCLAGPSKPPENKMAAVGSTKRLPWSHNDIFRLVRGSRPLDFFLPRIRRLQHQYPHALRCLEGTTMSNRGQRPRIRTQ